MSTRILIVDDEPDVATYLATVLRANGYDPTVANDVDTAIAKVGEISPAVICLDIMMPKKSGISLYAHLKQDASLASIPVVIISGVAFEGKFDFRTYMPDESVPPPECFLEKPINPEGFVKTISGLVASGRKKEKRGKA